MKYALISDIHANLPALEAVLTDIARRPDIGGTYHLGDLVGYAPWPDETVALIERAGIPGVAGNYDSTVATHYKHCGCKYEDPVQEQLSHLSYDWTLAHVSAATNVPSRRLVTSVKARGQRPKSLRHLMQRGFPAWQGSRSQKCQWQKCQ